MSKIKIEYTSNPAIIKFVASKILTESSFEYNSIDDAKNSALVQQLFHLPFVKKVFITAPTVETNFLPHLQNMTAAQVGRHFPKLYQELLKQK